MLRTYVRPWTSFFLPRGHDSASLALQAAAKPLQLVAGVWIQSVCHSSAGTFLLAVGMAHGHEIGKKRPRRLLAHLLAGGSSHERVGGDDADDLRRAMLGSQSFEHVVGVSCEADGERADLSLLADAVEDHHTASAPARDEAREGVHQLSTVGEVARVDEVVTVEEVQGRISHTHILPMAAGPGSPAGDALPRPYVVMRWRLAS